MKKNRLLWLISLVTAFIVSAVCAVAVFADNNSYVWDEVQLNSEYYVGEIFVAPEISVTLGEDEYPADFIFEYPNGDKFVDNDDNRTTDCEFSLTMLGDYKINYSAQVGDKTVSHVVTFNVKQNLFSATSDASSITFGKETYTYTKAGQSYQYSTGLSGINVSLAAGDTFHYNKVIDLSKMTKNDDLITLHMFPAVNGERECEDLEVILTDAYDPSNYIKFSVQSKADGPKGPLYWCNCDMFAAASGIGQVLTSYTPGAGVQVQVNTGVGANAIFTFYGQSPHNQKVNAEHPVTLKFDYANRQPWFKAANTPGTMICDFDDPFFFSTLWSGFTTGECFLSVQCVSNYKDTVNMLIPYIYGEDLSEQSLLVKDTEPTITIDTQGVDEDSVFTVVGKKFPIFKATAVDAYDGSLPVVVKAYNGYYSNAKTELDVVDGYFIADKQGVITLEYTTYSLTGEAFVKTIDVVVYPEDVIAVHLDDAKVVSGIAGDRIPVSPYTLVGNLGNVDVSVTVTKNNKQIPINEGIFVAESAGDYVVSYKGVDALGQVLDDSYTVAVAQNNNPVFIGDVLVPKYFIVGQKHVLPDFTAYDYATGTEKTISTTVKVNGVAGNEFTPSAEGDVVVEYIAQTSTGETIKTYNSKAIKVDNASKYLDFTKYFVADENVDDVESGTYGVKVSADDDAATASATFINYLNAYEFNVNFVIDPEQKDFEILDVYLRDVVDAENFIKISINTKTLAVKVNDKATSLVFSDGPMFNTTGNAASEIKFNGRTGTISIGGSDYVVEGFEPFFASVLAMEFVMNDIYGDAAFEIRQICNQSLRKQIKKDNMVPILAYNGNYGVYENFGTELTIFKAIATDVLNPTFNSYVTVLMPSEDGEERYAVAADGTVLNQASIEKDYVITLGEYGKFSIIYHTEDSSGKQLPQTKLMISVVDRTPPTITFTSGLPKTAKIGDVISLPTYTTSDNLEGEIKVSIVLTNEYDGRMIVLTDKDKTFTVSEYTTYKLTYIVSDIAGNVTLKTLKVSCKEG